MKQVKITVVDQHGNLLGQPDWYPCLDELTITVFLPDTQRSPTLRGADSQALELLRRFYQAWQAREDDEIIDGFVLEMGAVLESA